MNDNYKLSFITIQAGNYHETYEGTIPFLPDETEEDLSDYFRTMHTVLKLRLRAQDANSVQQCHF
jgi:hypothetical protein